MITIIVQATGGVAFLIGTVMLGRRIRRQPDRLTAKQIIRTNRLLCGSCLYLPGFIGIAYPGLTRYDALLGLAPLPFGAFAIPVGTFLLLSGLYLWASSHHHASQPRKRTAYYALHKLPRRGPYKHVRNPMSLGYYLGCFGTGLLTGSTYITMGSLLIVIPAHVSNLHFVRERSRAALYGSAYASYRRRVSFLIPGLRELGKDF